MANQTLSFNADLTQFFSYSLAGEQIKREQAAELLQDAASVCREYCFDYAPFDEAQVKALVKKHPKSLNELIAVMQGISPGKLEEELKPFLPVFENEKPDKARGAMNMALSCYFNQLFTTAFKPNSPVGKAGKNSGESRLVSNFDGWIAIKKSANGAESKEILAGLCGIFVSASKKAQIYSCANPDGISEWSALKAKYIEAIPLRRSFAKLTKALQEIPVREIESTALKAGGAENKEFLVNEFYSELMARYGYGPVVSLEDIKMTYPELKIPKPRGKVPGMKNKK